MRRLHWLLSLPLLVGSPASVLAQVDPAAADQIRTMGRKVDTLGTARIYAPMQKKAPYEGVSVRRNIAFGAHAKQGLDVFAPEGASKGSRPVLIMVHGGGFVAGDKTTDENGSQSAFYDNIMLWAVANGMIGVNINYRLAPEFQYPAAQEDVGAAVRWVHENIGQFGGDADNVALMGHSAGAAHVGSYIAHPEHGPAGKAGVSKVILSSGSYDFSNPGGSPHAYFGAAGAEMSSIPGLVATDLPYLVIVAEFDPPPFHVQAGKLMNAECSTGTCPPFVLAQGHGHMSGVYSINTPDRSLSGPILAFLKGEAPHLSVAAD